MGSDRGFGVVVTGAGPEATVNVRGGVDALTAPGLAAILEVLVGQGRRRVVLDLSDLAFMDTAGRLVVLDVLARLGECEFTIQPPRALPGGVHLAGMTEPAGLDWSEIPRGGLGPEELPGLLAALEPVEPAVLAGGLLRVAAVPANEDVLDAALRLVVALARVTVAGADGVSVSLRRRGALATVAASDETISGMDCDQYATGEGPCVSAAGEGHWFHVESLENETRWPAFIPRARERGIKSILSTPLRTRTRPAGALNLYSHTARAFTGPSLELASLFAARASDVLAAGAADVSVEDFAHQLQAAVRDRDILGQARGALMERHGISAAAADTTLRRSSQQAGTTLRKLAEDVVASTQPPPAGLVGAPDDA